MWQKFDIPGFHITYNCTFLRKVLVKNVIANLLRGGKTYGNVISFEGKKRKVVKNWGLGL